MKKLLLLLVPLLLLMGVSFGDTWVYNTFTPGTNPTSSLSSHGKVFHIIGSSGSSIELYSLQQSYINLTYSGERCNMYNISRINDDNTMTDLASGYLTDITGETLINLSLSPGNYIAYAMADFGNCRSQRTASNVATYISGFFIAENYSNFYYPQTPYPGSSISFSYSAGFDYFTFSGTDPRIATSTPITIHYNGTTTGYAGTDLYIDQPIKSTYTSGGFLHFVIQTFRTLFRRN